MRRPTDRVRALGAASVAAIGLCLFALFAHRTDGLRFLSFGGLAASACVLALALGRSESALDLVGLRRWPRTLLAWVPFGAALGLGLGSLCRFCYGHGAVPTTLTPFVVVAVLIGTTEELVYRGCLQGLMRPWGANLAIWFGAVAHTAYKVALFGDPVRESSPNFLFLILATYIVGTVLGGLRHVSRSVVPAVALHAAFDIIVYGDRLAAPWWVWR